MAAKKKTEKKAGRPPTYNAKWAPKFAEAMARLGMIDKDVAAMMGIAESTFHKWKKDFPEFAKALKQGKAEPNQKVEAALFLRALGYSHEDTWIGQYQGQEVVVPYIKHYPPDVMACMYWLNNRCRDDPSGRQWRQRQEVVNTFDDTVKALADAIRTIGIDE